MRDVSAELIAKLTPSRTFDAEYTFRDTRLVFTDRVLSDSLGLSDPSTADACLYSTGFLRVVNNDIIGNRKLYYQDIPDPSLASWPNWVDTSIVLKQNSVPGVEGGRVWYQKTNGDICYRTYTGSMSAETVVTSAYAAFAVTCAPVDTNYCYIHYLDGEWARVTRLHTSLAAVEWQGRVYSENKTTRYFDAVRLGSTDHLFVADNDFGRLLTMTVLGDVWSDLVYVVPLDVIDDTSFFTLGAAKVIDEQIFLAGRLSRKTDLEPVKFDIYMIGPDGYTMGRNMFITDDEVCGTFLLLGSVVYYFGVNSVSEATASMLVGVDTASLKLTTKKSDGFRLSTTYNESFKINVGLDPSLSHAALRLGAELVLKVSISGEEAQVAVFGVDSISPTWTQQGRNSAVMARSLNVKKLSNWTSDQSYDYWSQTKQSSQVAEMKEVVRAEGTFEVSEGPLILQDLNEDGVLYMVAKASRGGLMRGRFYKPSGDITCEYGVALNYYRETRYEASERLEKEIEDVSADEIGHNGILAKWGATEHSGAPGVGLYLWLDNVLTKITSGARAIPDDEWHWLQINFQDGLIKVYYLAHGATAWVEVLSTIFDDAEFLPWKRETFGRGAIYMKNGTVWGNTTGFDSLAQSIPVDDVTDFPASEIVRVDDEKIEYDGKTPGTGPGTLTWYGEGHTLFQAVHDNQYFADLDLGTRTAAVTPVNQKIGDSITNLHVGHALYFAGAPAMEGKGKFRLTKMQYKVRKTGAPGPLYLHFCTDNYDNMPPRDYNIIATASVPAEDIGGAYDWETWTFDTEWLPADAYFGMLSLSPTGITNVWDAANYYEVLMCTEAPVTPFRNTRRWNGTIGYHWQTLEYAAPMKVEGADRAGDGFEIYLDAAGADTAREYYDGMALVCTAGPGEGKILTVSDYDYQAPDQWVPSQEYEPPDKWQDHIGEDGHGAWVTPDLSRIFTVEKNDGIFGVEEQYEDEVLTLVPSQFVLTPALLVKSRGYDDTSVTSHGPGKVSIDTALSIKCDRADFYSLEQDFMMEDMIRELGVKAGIRDFDFQQILEEGISFETSADWNTPRWVADRTDCIMRFTMPTLGAGSEVGIVYRVATTGEISALVQGYMVTITDDDKLKFRIFGAGPSMTLLEEFPIGFTPEGEVRMSVYEDSCSIWVNGRFIHTFRDGTWSDGANAGVTAYNDFVVSVEWSNLDMRVDNFIFDMGHRGAQLLHQLIGPKRIFFYDGQFGALKVFRARTDIGSIPGLMFQGGRTDSEQELWTRIRAEGYEIAEVIDFEMLKEHGNLFGMVNAIEADNAWEAFREGTLTLQDILNQYLIWNLSGAADPRLEPQDIVELALPPDDYDVIILGIEFTMNADETQPTFDMNVFGGTSGPLP